MQLLKLAFISALVFFVLLTGISLLIPSSVRISRAVDINAGKMQILPLLNDLHQWEKWNIYIDSLPSKQILSTTRLQSTDLSVQIQSADTTAVTAEWQQHSGQTFNSVYRLISHENITTVQWYFDFKLKWYPWEKFSSIIYDQQFGPVMEQSLNNLKAMAGGNQ